MGSGVSVYTLPNKSSSVDVNTKEKPQPSINETKAKEPLWS